MKDGDFLFKICMTKKSFDTISRNKNYKFIKIINYGTTKNKRKDYPRSRATVNPGQPCC